MKSTQLLHIVGGGIFLGSVVAAGGTYDNSGHPAGQPLVRACSLDLADVRDAVARVITGLTGETAIAITKPTTGYTKAQVRHAREKLEAGEGLSIYETSGGPVLWKGTLVALLAFGESP